MMLAATAMAQETYESAQLLTQDLNGTARYVGMGGAMEALGADISTISTNPAGIGLFRRSWVGGSMGLTSQKGDDADVLGAKFDKTGKTNVDFNQIGFVISTKMGYDSYFNMALNYHKSRNFNQIMSAVNSLDHASLNGMTYMRVASLHPDKKTWLLDKDSRWETVGLADEVNYELVNSTLEGYDLDGNWCDGYSTSNRYALQTNNSGYISNFDFNFSGNIKNRVFLGLSLGVKSVNYENRTRYEEVLTSALNHERGYFELKNDREITGSGFDVKFGGIFRPIEDNPFRFGLYINTPTWYSLSCRGSMGGKAGLEDYDVTNSTQYGFDYNYKIITPWKFGASVGTTFGNMVALGATYEYSDYSTVRSRIDEGGYYDSWYNDYFSTSSRDYDMERNTERALKGVSLVKLGMEVKPVPEVAIRVGYNYQGAIYNESGSKDAFMNANKDYASVGAYYSTYDYTNWKSTQRLTFGLGFALGQNCNLDLSYQYATQTGNAHPFQSVYDVTTYKTNDEAVSSVDDNVTFVGTPTKVKNDRHQVNLTLSYKF